MASECIPLETILPQPIPYGALATRLMALSLLASLILSVFACKIGKDDVTNFKLSSQPSFDHPTNASPPETDPDFISLPSTYQEFYSPEEKYIFVLSAVDDWASKQAIGELFEVVDGNRQSLWTCSLPHEYGPRYVLVSAQGQVLLLDEWINVASRQAVMLLGRENTLLAKHSFDAIQEILAVPRARIVALSRYGWWITSPPTLDLPNETARVETAGKILMINLEDGELSVVGSE